MMTTELISVPKTGASNNRHRSRQDFSTPTEFISAVERRFGRIQVDLAADETNHKADLWLGPGGLATDALKEPWIFKDRLCWLNPPFSDIAPWARKCREYNLQCKTQILLLVPASVDSNWWMNYVHNYATVYFVNPRLKFVGATDPYPKPLALCHYHTDRGGRAWYQPWRWR